MKAEFEYKENKIPLLGSISCPWKGKAKFFKSKSKPYNIIEALTIDLILKYMTLATLCEYSFIFLYHRVLGSRILRKDQHLFLQIE